MGRYGFLAFAVCLVMSGLVRTSPVLAGEVRVPLGGHGAGSEIVVDVQSIKELREDGVVLQQLDYSCGSAALSTLFTSYLEQPYSEMEIIDFILRTGDMQKIIVRKGFSLLDLKRFADSHGIEATGYGLDFPSLVEFDCPVLVPLYRKDANIRHFVIFRGASEDRVFLADPAIGRRTMLRSEFEEAWNPRVGMVFRHPGTPPAEHTGLSLGPQDATYLSASSLRAVISQSAFQYIHQANEF
jgi:predicted double-glycine peptidase